MVSSVRELFRYVYGPFPYVYELFPYVYGLFRYAGHPPCPTRLARASSHSR